VLTTNAALPAAEVALRYKELREMLKTVAAT